MKETEKSWPIPSSSLHGGLSVELRVPSCSGFQQWGPLVRNGFWGHRLLGFCSDLWLEQDRHWGTEKDGREAKQSRRGAIPKETDNRLGGRLDTVPSSLKIQKSYLFLYFYFWSLPQKNLIFLWFYCLFPKHVLAICCHQIILTFLFSLFILSGLFQR